VLQWVELLLEGDATLTQALHEAADVLRRVVAEQEGPDEVEL
jgi:hypothetical protein